MNRKRKLNDLYKGVFKNDKKSCLVDLKPLDKKRELENKVSKEVGDENINKLNNQDWGNSAKGNQNITKFKSMNVSLKVDKHLRFGTFFKRLREEIVDVFLAKDDFISYEDLINSSHINELFNNSFNNRDSSNKTIIEMEKSKNQSLAHILDQSYNNKVSATLIDKSDFIPIEEENEEILYEDDMETIYKRKKPMSRRMNTINNLSNRKLEILDNSQCNRMFDIANIVNLTKGRPSHTINSDTLLTSSSVNNNTSHANSHFYNSNPFIPITHEERHNFKKMKNVYMEVENDESVSILSKLSNLTKTSRKALGNVTNTLNY